MNREKEMEAANKLGEQMAGGGWNYRVIINRDEKKGMAWCEIAEVFYTKDGKIHGYALRMHPHGSGDGSPEALAELRGDLKLMLKAFDRPPLERSDLR